MIFLEFSFFEFLGSGKAIMRIRILKFSRIDLALALKNNMHVPGRKDLPNQLCIHLYLQEQGGGYPNQNDNEMTPQTSKILEKRRSIWQKGTIKCLKMHLFHVHVYSGSI